MAYMRILACDTLPHTLELPHIRKAVYKIGNFSTRWHVSEGKFTSLNCFPGMCNSHFRVFFV